MISVLMPVHNCGPYLRPALESILAQDYGNLEVLLIDDHTDDGSVEGLPRELRLDPRLFIHSSPGRGITTALNFAAAESRGEFIARMDGDDISLPDRFTRQLAYLRERPEIGIVSAQVEIFGASKPDEGFVLYQNWLNDLREPEDIAREIFIESPLPHPAVVFRREVFEKLGGYRDPEWAEDYDMWLRANEAGILMGKPKGILVRWREHGARLTHNDPRYSGLAFFKARASFLASGPLRDRPAILWGAGRTGLMMHDALIEEGVAVRAFIDVNPRLVGREKRGRPVLSMEEAKNAGDALILGAVGARGAREKIREALRAMGKIEGPDFLFVA